MILFFLVTLNIIADFLRQCKGDFAQFDSPAARGYSEQIAHAGLRNLRGSNATHIVHQFFDALLKPLPGILQAQIGVFQKFNVLLRAEPFLLTGQLRTGCRKNSGRRLRRSWLHLQGNCCSIYEVRPRTCRLYPFAVDYGRNGRSFEYLLCTEKPHHLCGGRTSVNQWMQENLSREYKEFLIHSHTFLQETGGLLRRMSRENQESLLSMFLFLYDTGYDFDQPFLPQHKSRTTRILDILKRESK